MKKFFTLLSLLSLIHCSFAGLDADTLSGIHNEKLQFSRKSTMFGTQKLSRYREFGDYPSPILTLFAGGAMADVNGRIQINSVSLGKGTDIDLDKDLGFDPTLYMPMATAYIRIAKRHQVELGIWGFGQKNTRSLSRAINFRDTTFDINTSVSSRFYFRCYTANYKFSIIKAPVGELGLSLGTKLFDVYGKLTANLNDLSYAQKAHYYLPVPFPGIHGSFYLTKFLLLRGSVEYFKIGAGKWDFHVLDIKPSIEFYPFKNIGVGAAYNHFDIQVDKAPKDELDGTIKLKLNSANVFVCVRL